MKIKRLLLVPILSIFLILVINFNAEAAHSGGTPGLANVNLKGEFGLPGTGLPSNCTALGFKLPSGINDSGGPGVLNLIIDASHTFAITNRTVLYGCRINQIPLDYLANTFPGSGGVATLSARAPRKITTIDGRTFDLDYKYGPEGKVTLQALDAQGNPACTGQLDPPSYTGSNLLFTELQKLGGTFVKRDKCTGPVNQTFGYKFKVFKTPINPHSYNSKGPDPGSQEPDYSEFAPTNSIPNVPPWNTKEYWLPYAPFTPPPGGTTGVWDKTIKYEFPSCQGLPGGNIEGFCNTLGLDYVKTANSCNEDVNHLLVGRSRNFFNPQVAGTCPGCIRGPSPRPPPPGVYPNWYIFVWDSIEGVCQGELPFTHPYYKDIQTKLNQKVHTRVENVFKGVALSSITDIIKKGKNVYVSLTTRSINITDVDSIVFYDKYQDAYHVRGNDIIIKQDPSGAGYLDNYIIGHKGTNPVHPQFTVTKVSAGKIVSPHYGAPAGTLAYNWYEIYDVIEIQIRKKGEGIPTMNDVRDITDNKYLKFEIQDLGKNNGTSFRDTVTFHIPFIKKDSVQVPLKAYIGQNITVRFKVKDGDNDNITAVITEMGGHYRDCNRFNLSGCSDSVNISYAGNYTDVTLKYTIPSTTRYGTALSTFAPNNKHYVSFTAFDERNVPGTPYAAEIQIIDPPCSDNLRGENETDLDCGGGTCPGCGAGGRCNNDSDCDPALYCFVDPSVPPITSANAGARNPPFNLYGVGVCRQPTCSDGIQNQGETGVDCGGPCTACQVAQDCWICSTWSLCSQQSTQSRTCQKSGIIVQPGQSCPSGMIASTTQPVIQQACLNLAPCTPATAAKQCGGNARGKLTSTGFLGCRGVHPLNNGGLCSTSSGLSGKCIGGACVAFAGKGVTSAGNCPKCDWSPSCIFDPTTGDYIRIRNQCSGTYNTACQLLPRDKWPGAKEVCQQKSGIINKQLQCAQELVKQGFNPKLSTDFLAVADFSKVYLKLGNSFGQITFLQPLDLSGFDCKDIGNQISIKKNSVEASSTFNKEALVTFFDTKLKDPVITRDGQCLAIEVLKYDGKDLIFKVPRFSSYQAVEKALSGCFGLSWLIWLLVAIILVSGGGLLLITIRKREEKEKSLFRRSQNA